MTTNYPQEETQRYVNPNSLSQQESYDYHHFLKRQDPYQRRFSYTSMLSDADPCYLPAVSNSSPSSNHSEDYPSQQHTPPPTSSNPSGMQSFMDYVDLQSKPPVNQQSIYHPTMPYYEAHSKNLLNYDEHYSHRNAMIQMSSQQQQQQNGFSSMCSTPTPHHLSMKQERPMTPVSPPLKDENAAQQSSTIPDKLKRVPRSRGRRVSNVPGCGTRMFTCKADGCGKVFKRSEHLKRHIRSIHTLEKRKLELFYASDLVTHHASFSL
ncbi:hypothetical protein A0J61_07511 [Choanephora cucurbitarum]|uniref:C2H2-type domain-containing protein n=1 Tax=Choanephora cucurbitarum TaxID=101091 RepID=A0A1C7N708_9FUNG|nr:hypothetical protein A0J61_07511 [Choanephora cucurbitarum]